jgi:hypothetical protein
MTAMSNQVSRAALAAFAAAFACAVLVATAPLEQARAHHSGAMFEDTRTLELSGTVTRFEYVNPHSWLYINVVDKDGKVTEWGFELDSPSRLRRIGVSPNHWQEGDRVTVRTRPLKDGRPAGFLVGAVSSQGRTFGQANGLTLAAESTR